MGLPVLEASLGPWARSIAIQYDLFACTPLLLSVGILVASRYGTGGDGVHPLRALVKVPPLWAALAGVMLNLAQVPLPAVLGGGLDMLGAGVVPLMLFSIGLGLRWAGGWWHRMPEALPVIAIQLLVTPAIAWLVAGGLGLGGDVRVAVVLEAAMPSMVLGIVICDRYRLDSALYAMVVTLSTALSLVTLPAWFDLLR
jgi:predicted permease